MQQNLKPLLPHPGVMLCILIFFVIGLTVIIQAISKVRKARRQKADDWSARIQKTLRKIKFHTNTVAGGVGVYLPIFSFNQPSLVDYVQIGGGMVLANFRCRYVDPWIKQEGSILYLCDMCDLANREKVPGLNIIMHTVIYMAEDNNWKKYDPSLCIQSVVSAKIKRNLLVLKYKDGDSHTKIHTLSLTPEQLKRCLTKKITYQTDPKKGGFLFATQEKIKLLRIEYKRF